MALKPGELLHQRYRIAGLLEQGGFGAVYRAWDISLGHPCAVKENLDASAEARQQFEREAKILAGLSHPNLPRVTDHFFIAAQGQYLVMDLVEGQDLQAMLDSRGGPLDEAQVVNWAGQVCDALAYLHSQEPPVIHRDVKPANIRITPGGKAMLVDFGIAKVYDPRLKTTLGARAVTPGYSPFEQYGAGTLRSGGFSASEGSTDARTDVYALGATLYTLLTGQEPPESIQRVVREPLVLMSRLNPALSTRTVQAIHRAMQMDPEQRFQSAAAFKAALLPGGAPPISAGPIRRPAPGAMPRTPKAGIPFGQIKPAWRIGGLVVLAVGFVLLGSLAGGVFRISRHEAAKESPTLTLDSLHAATPLQTPVITIARPTTPVEESPGDTPEPTPLPWIYIIQAGDTCSEIAQRFGVSMLEIVRLNNLTEGCNQLFAGQKLLIPFSALAATPGALTPEAFPSPIATRVSELDGMVQVYVPAGIFWMGSEGKAAQADEKPRRVVYLDAFWIDQHEVTNEMYARCVRAGACQPPEKQSSSTRLFYYGKEQFQDYPVVYVSWVDASAYCKWAGRRLPTEAEWEKAARGVDGRLFPWGEAAPDSSRLNFNQRVGDTTLVGSYPAGASPYDVMDMAGNVAEWVADWYAEDYYSIAAAINPLGPAVGEFRGVRGGSWFSSEEAVRSSFRLWYLPDKGYDSSGFRCAAYPQR
jgi:formylglycine-generating enzyme required for sulfatase activity/serine/threonine protein kinase